MLDLEEQIAQLADAAVDQTEPVQFFEGVNPRGRSGRGRALLVAGSVATVLLVGLAVWSRLSMTGEPSVETIDIPRVVIVDPQAIDLDALIPLSEQRRVNSIGPLLTFDFEALGDGWTVTRWLAATTGGGAPYAEYRQAVQLRSPERVDYAVSVTGPLVTGGAPVELAETLDPIEPVEVRGQPGRLQFGHLEWIEDGRATVWITQGDAGRFEDHTDDMLALAGALQPMEVDTLDWHTPDLPANTPSVDGDAPGALLSGVVNGESWSIHRIGTGVELARGGSHSMPGQGQFRTDTTIVGATDPAAIELTLEGLAVPGGTLAWGVAPDRVAALRLELVEGTIEVPVAALGDGRVAYAVPIADELDPVRLVYLDGDGRHLAERSLIGLPPFMAGAGGMRVPFAR